MKRWVKILIVVVVVAVLAAAVVISRQRSTHEEVEVEVEAVEARDLTAVVEASGQIEPKVSVDISSDVIGKIMAMGAEEGDRVKKGQFLIQIDPIQFEQRAARLEAELATARTNLAEAEANAAIRQSDFERDKRLHEEKLIPLSRYEATQAAYEVARAQVASAGNRIRQAEASLNEARDQLGRTRIVSPMDGVVIRKNAEVGEVAISGTLNNQGSLLMTIADLSVMETEVDVDETDVVHVTLGQEVEVSLDAFPARTFKGEVTRIGNSAIQMATAPGERQSADYKVEVTLLESDERIRPGLSATARITTARRSGALSVPIQSLVVREVGGEEDGKKAGASATGAPSGEAGGGAGVALAADTSNAGGGPAPAAKDDGEAKKEELEGVFVLRDGKAVFVPVKTGIAGEKYFEVLDGLQAGDQVVSGDFAALRKLKDGDHVKLKKPKPEKART